MSGICVCLLVVVSIDMTRQLLYLHLIELKLSAVRGRRSLVSLMLLLGRDHRGLGEHLALVDHDVEGLIVLLYSFDVSWRFHFLVVVLFFLRRRRILFVEYSFNVILKVLIFEVSDPLSLFALIQSVFESVHFARIVTHRTARSSRLGEVMRVLLLLVSVATTILDPLLLVKGTQNAIKLSFHLAS